jgi:hypothetical protein
MMKSNIRLRFVYTKKSAGPRPNPLPTPAVERKFTIALRLHQNLSVHFLLISLLEESYMKL